MSRFEPLRDQLESLRVPAGEARQLIWIARGRLGAALTATGSYEIFLVGPELKASSPLVARHLQHDKWEPEPGGSAFDATRVLLGSAAHFAAMAALIGTELERFDLSTDEALQGAFSDVEPIIEMAIRRSALSDEALLGLIAELHVLKVALISSRKEQRAAVLLGWRGWTRGRDFVFSPNAIEVKATTSNQSRHRFSGIHQLEPENVDGQQEILSLLSIGLAEVDEGGQALPELLDELLSLLAEGSTRTDTQLQLLRMVASYGGSDSASYDHDEHAGLAIYQRRFSLTFGRLYDVSDPQMKLLTRDLLEQTIVTPESVTFEIAAPSRVSAFNPSENWQKELGRMVNHSSRAHPSP